MDPDVSRCIHAQKRGRRAFGGRKGQSSKYGNTQLLDPEKYSFSNRATDNGLPY